MNITRYSLLFSILILGCSSSQPTDVSDRYKSFTGGQSVGNSTSFYWYTEQLSLPYSAADFVTSGEYGWYKSDYRWREGVVREIIREGEQRESSKGLVSYKVHLRFNNSGEAVYQQYRLDGKVLPVPPQQIPMLQNEAINIQEVTKDLERKGIALIQGYWDGKEFTTCNDTEYESVEFNQTLPSFVINRLATLESYAAFLGSETGVKLVIRDLLLLEDDDYDCVERPVFIDEQ